MAKVPRSSRFWYSKKPSPSHLSIFTCWRFLEKKMNTYLLGLMYSGVATVLQKLHCGDAAALPADDVLHMATVGGAQAMGLSDCDVLAPGKQADLIVIDLQRPNMQPVHNAARNLVYSGSKENVRLTMIAGRVLYENGAFVIGEPVQDIYRAVETHFAAMRAAL